jgi:hypothetical protein
MNKWVLIWVVYNPRHGTGIATGSHEFNSEDSAQKAADAIRFKYLAGLPAEKLYVPPLNENFSVDTYVVKK